MHVLVDTVVTAAQTAASGGTMSWEQAVYAFAGVFAVYAIHTLRRMDAKMSQTLVLLHGVPEQHGKGGVVAKVEKLEVAMRMALNTREVTHARLDAIERQLQGHPTAHPRGAE
jgi:hypothetical protein